MSIPRRKWKIDWNLFANSCGCVVVHWRFCHVRAWAIYIDNLHIHSMVIVKKLPHEITFVWLKFGWTNISASFMHHNGVRLWFREIKLFFWLVQCFDFDLRLLDAHNVSSGDLTARKNLRKQLKCQNFRWYLENVYPESSWLKEYILMGEVSESYWSFVNKPFIQCVHSESGAQCSK